MCDLVIQDILEEIKDNCDIDTYNYISSVITVKLKEYSISKDPTELIVYETSASEEIFKKFFVTKKIQGLSKRSLERYKSDLVRVFKTIGKPINEITTDDIKYFLACLQIKNKCSPTTINNYRLSLSTFFSFCEDEEFIPRSPIRKIKKIRVKKKNKKAFSNTELEMLRMECQKIENDIKRKRAIAIIEVLISTGARAGELIKLELTDINFETGEVLIREGKGGKDRIVYLNDVAKLRLIDYIEIRDDKRSNVFISFIKPYRSLKTAGLEVFIRDLGKKANVSNTHPHRFRRTCATLLNKRGMAISEISQYLGHENISTTQLYLQVDSEQVRQSHIKYMN